MNLRIHLIRDGPVAVLLHFLKSAIEFQDMYSTVIATDENEQEFFETHGYTKKDLREAVNLLKKALK